MTEDHNISAKLFISTQGSIDQARVPCKMMSFRSIVVLALLTASMCDGQTVLDHPRRPNPYVNRHYRKRGGDGSTVKVTTKDGDGSSRMMKL